MAIALGYFSGTWLVTQKVLVSSLLKSINTLHTVALPAMSGNDKEWLVINLRTKLNTVILQPFCLNECLIIKKLMKKIIIFLITSLAIFSCDDEVERIELSVRDFTIEVPSNWTLEEVQGFDSYVRRIKINEHEIIGIDLGWYSSSLNVDDLTHNITLKILDNRDAKIVYPKNFGQGTTGVYFDSLDNQGTKLQMSGFDLSEANQHLFLTAIETIKFK